LPNYFPQVEAKEKASAKRRPDKGPPRSEHISMRLTPDERIRLNYWCDARNLSIPDGVMALLSIAERLEGE
jgi:hypothetical protein